MERIEIVNKIADFVANLSIELPADVLKRLDEMERIETHDSAKAVFGSIKENLRLAKELRRPICQDTGIVQIFAKVGTKFEFIDSLEEILVEAVAIASKTVPLRPNAVETFDEFNTGTNTGTRCPWIEYSLVPNSDKLELLVYLAGGGCSLPGKSEVLPPSEGYEGIKKRVLEVIINRGVNACPPLVVGVGVSSCSATAASLAKKATLREIGVRNSNPLVSAMEEDLENAINSLEIGCQGLGGKTTVYAVNIEKGVRHPSTLAYSVMVGCYVHRRGTLII